MTPEQTARLADLKRMLAARERMGTTYAANVAAIRAEIERLESGGNK